MNPTQEGPSPTGPSTRRRWWWRVVVEGSSMAPALQPGDRLLVLRRRPRPGSIVALRDPRTGRLIVKRAAVVTPDAVDVRGDNAAASTDSRTFGPVPRCDVLGVAVYRYGPPERAGRLGDGGGRGGARG